MMRCYLQKIAMTSESKSYFEKHTWGAVASIALGAISTIACVKFLYFDPAEKELALLRRQVEETKNSPELHKCEIENKQILSNLGMV